MEIYKISSGESQSIYQCAEIISSEHAWQLYEIDLNKAIEILTSMPDQIYAIKENNIVQGFATLRLQGIGNIGAYVRMVAVRQDCRGQSMGRYLIDYVQKEAEKQGDKNIFLICSADNQNASRFYEAIGFNRVGILTDLVIVGHDEILYRRTYKSKKNW
ncbi:MAG: GNAT family N-acetyltransferase [Lachnospiraceae bacterium]